MSSSADMRIRSPTRPNQMTIGCRRGATLTPQRCPKAHKLGGSGLLWQGPTPPMRAFAWFLALLGLALAAVAAFTYPAWLLLHPHFSFPFHRIGERIGMLALLLGFIAVARRLQLADRASLGYGLPRPVFVRELGFALLIGVLSMAAVVGMMAALGLIAARDGAPHGALALARLVGLRALSGLAVALIEETFLRGAMHTAIARESGTRTAVLLTALLYAATHFFASYHIAPADVTARSGLALLAGTLHLLAHPAGIADAFLALLDR